MKRIRALPIVLLGLVLASCSTGWEGDNPYPEMDREVKQGVDLWTSIHYRLVTDRQTIDRIDHPQHELASPIMIEVLASATNKGEERAEGLQAFWDEPLPMKYAASTSSSEDHGYLDNNESLVYHATFTFGSRSDADDFIQAAALLLKWKENGVSQQQNLPLPAMPMQ